MKKIYNSPQAYTINLSAEASMMLSVSVSEDASQGDDWSNERDWNTAEGGFQWSNATEED